MHSTSDRQTDYSETSYSFKFTNSKLEVHSTKQLNKPATSVFSGAILAIKEFLENHKNVIYFSIDAIKNELNRKKISILIIIVILHALKLRKIRIRSNYSIFFVLNLAIEAFNSNPNNKIIQLIQI